MGNEPNKAPEKSVKDQIREQKRAIQRKIKVIEREKKNCENEERKMKSELKKITQAGQIVNRNFKKKSGKLIAKDIVRLRTNYCRMNEYIGYLKIVELRIGSLDCLDDLSNAMEIASSGMKNVSERIEAKKLNKMVKLISIEDSKLEMKTEIMSDLFENMGEQSDNPEEIEKIYKEVLQEVGLGIENEMPKAIDNTHTNNNNIMEDDLDKMLAEIKK